MKCHTYKFVTYRIKACFFLFRHFMIANWFIAWMPSSTIGTIFEQYLFSSCFPFYPDYNDVSSSILFPLLLSRYSVEFRCIISKRGLLWQWSMIELTFRQWTQGKINMIFVNKLIRMIYYMFYCLSNTRQASAVQRSGLSS